MKKNLWKYLLVPSMVLAVSLTACREDGSNDSPVDEDEKGNVFVTTETVTPLKYTDLKYIGGDEGVTIEVTRNETDNFVFTCEPGSEVAAYRMNVYPVSSLYNTLLNALNESKLEKFTVDQVNELLLNMITNFDSEVTGGKLMNSETLGEDFAYSEFDWMNSGYAKIAVKPSADYLIVVQAYFDEAGKDSQADLCLVHVKTPEKDLIGNPSVDIDVTAGFYSFMVKHLPNEDCSGFYYLSSNAAEIDQYINAYGEDMYADFLRHYGGFVKGDYTFKSGDELRGVWYCATALAIDKNGAPADKINRKDFKLKELPSETDEAIAEVKLPKKVSASVCLFDIHMEPNCMRTAYNVYRADAADDLMAKDEDFRKSIALQMVRGLGNEQYPGWIVVNRNFAMDYDEGKITGEAWDETGWQHELEGGQKYKIVYACMNGYGEATDLKCTEAFTTKNLVTDRPEDCTAEVDFKVADQDRTAFYLETIFNTDNTARIYWQYYAPVSKGAEGHFTFPDIKDASDDARYGRGKYTRTESWLYWFLEWRDPSYGFPWPNETVGAFSGGIVKDDTYFSGFKPGITYSFAYMAEDWNGVLGPVKFFEGTTREVKPGNNPKVEISYEKSEDGNIEVTYTANEDIIRMYYMQEDSNGNRLNVSDLLKPDFDGITYEDFIEDWSLKIMNLGLKTQALTLTQEIESDADLVVALAMAEGGVDEPVFSELQVLVFDNKNDKVMTLKEYMGVK